LARFFQHLPQLPVSFIVYERVRLEKKVNLGELGGKGENARTGKVEWEK
jgi:hypothetical protein